MVDRFTTGAGCDSIERTVVTINPSYDITNRPITACDSAQVNGNWYYSSQTVVDRFTTGAGCDSIERTVVTINPSYDITNNPITACDSAQVNGNWYYSSQTVVDRFTTGAGCDSIERTVVTINPSYDITNRPITACDSAQVNGNWYYSSQTVVDRFTTGAGCDSIERTVVTINPSYDITNRPITACDSAQVNGNWYYSSQTVVDRFTTGAGCDSIERTVVTINPSYDITNNPITACDSAQVNGNWYYSSQTVVDRFTTGAGCDSIERTVVTINPSYDITNNPITACDSAQVNGNWYYSSQTVVDRFTTGAGCDSIERTVVTINPSYDITNNPITACDSAQVNGNWYYSSQTVVDRFTTGAGCDSIERTVVMINYRDDITNTPVEECDSAQVNGNWYYSSQTVVDNFTNVYGCDSVETTVVTINVSPTVTLMLTDTACSDDTAFVLTGGSPAGGVYSGTGVNSTDGTFDAKAMGAGKHLITYTYTDATTGCKNSAEDSLSVIDCYVPYCTYTQGFWGNARGKANSCDSTDGLDTKEILDLILKDTSIVLGDYAESCTDNWRSFTIYEDDALNILAVLPAGGPSKKLDPVKGKCKGNDWETKYNTEFTSTSGGNMSPSIRQKKRSSNIANTLVGQTLALSLNTLVDKSLPSLVIEGDTIHTEKSRDCDSGRLIPNGDYQKDVMPSVFRTYFGGNYTVAQLLELANNALSGKYVPKGSDPSLSDITKALATINEAFDECRLLTGFTSPDASSSQSSNQSVASTSALKSLGYEVNAYPNPFNGSLKVDVNSDIAAKATIQIYDVRGRLVSTVDKNCEAGENSFRFDTNSLVKGVYFVKVKIGEGEVNIKMLKMDK